MEECVLLARGVNQATAMETALKLTETSYVRAHPWSAADFLHGPIAAIDEGFPCILYVSRGRTEAAMLDLARQLFERRAECLLITDSDDCRRVGERAHCVGIFPPPSPQAACRHGRNTHPIDPHRRGPTVRPPSSPRQRPRSGRAPWSAQGNRHPLTDGCAVCARTRAERGSRVGRSFIPPS